jgi:hypothetical protein
MRPAWEQRLKDWKLIGEAMQPFILILGVIGAVATFAASEWHSAQGRDKEARDRLEARSQPFFQKQLDTYAEATRVVARLAVTPQSDPTYAQAVAHFWELYWGSLSLVESESKDRMKFEDCRAVEPMMVDFCLAYVSPKDPSRCISPGSDQEKLALDLAHHAALEIKDRWKDGLPVAPDKCKEKR